jgi:hypothetical protein
MRSDPHTGEEYCEPSEILSIGGVIGPEKPICPHDIRDELRIRRPVQLISQHLVFFCSIIHFGGPVRSCTLAESKCKAD